jgi:iron(III) transport system permease protein
MLKWSLGRTFRAFRDPQIVLFTGVAAIVAFLVLYPTVFLFYGSVTDTPLGVPGTLTFKNYIEAYSDLETYTLLVNSLVFSLGSATLSVTMGLLLAWVTVRTNAFYRTIFGLTAILPNILPPLLVSISWMFLLNPTNGLINVWFEFFFGFKPFNIYSMGGLIWVEALVTAPLAFLIIAGALRRMDPALEEAAKAAGSSELRVIGRITVPLMKPAILAAWFLNFIRAIESFDTPAIIAVPAGIDVFTTKIYREAMGSFPTNHNLAATYGVGLLAITLLSVRIYRRTTSHAERYATVTGKGFRSQLIDLGRWRFLVSCVPLLLLTVMVLLPLLTLLLLSVLPYYHVPTWSDLVANVTLKHYRFVFQDDRVLTAIWNSFRLAIGGATLCMVLACLVSYITVRSRIPGRGILEGLAFVPWAFPGTALAIGLLWAYINFPLPVYNTLWLLLIAYVTRFLPYGLRATNSTIIQIHNELEEASVACGAGFLTTFRRILVPLMRPGVIAGWIILATTFIREFGTSIFLYSPGAEPIGPMIYFLFQDNLYGVVGAIGLLVCLLSMALIAAARAWSKAELL